MNFSAWIIDFFDEKIIIHLVRSSHKFVSTIWTQIESVDRRAAFPLAFSSIQIWTTSFLFLILSENELRIREKKI